MRKALLVLAALTSACLFQGISCLPNIAASDRHTDPGYLNVVVAPE